ncbi:sigma-70 family RNA polymerase sigma factor [Kitasatospora sp. NPDC048540]|uniref:sigma-70 family RNA polymerase sigma factor n=1 Tax=Kitasatospora sp. NPDC048540 TaxID=3155634 RepID=UPI0033E7E9FB
MTTPTQTRTDAPPADPPGPAPGDLRRLLALSGHGDEAAFELLYRAISGPVYGVALRVLRSRAHAEEVAQEVLVEVWRAAATYRPAHGSVLAWVLTIAHHRAVDRVRSARAAADRERRSALRELVAGARSDPPDEQVVRSLDGAEVRSALAGLSRLQREAVVLAYYGGYSQREIAQLLGVPLGTVKSRIRGGLTRLRAAFGLDPDGPRPMAAPAYQPGGTR